MNKLFVLKKKISPYNKVLKIMSYEAGSKECRHLIEAKESLLLAMESLSNISSTDILQIQIKEIYNKLEGLHDKRKKIEFNS